MEWQANHGGVGQVQVLARVFRVATAMDQVRELFSLVVVLPLDRMGVRIVDYIRRYYGVNAKRGGRVRYTGGQKGERFGTIKSARGGYLRIVLDGDKHAGNFHPTWKLEYL